MIAAYVRTSTTHQKHDSQINEITKWLKARGHDLDQVEWYSDQVSGTTLDRPEFERLQADIFCGKVKTVILYKLDRLSRRLKDGINILSYWCESGVKVVVVTQQLELDGPVGRMLSAVLLGLSEIEWSHRASRVRAGVEAARLAGKYHGRKEGTFKASPERAMELKERGLNNQEIATALGVSKRTVMRYFKV